MRYVLALAMLLSSQAFGQVYVTGGGSIGASVGGVNLGAGYMASRYISVEAGYVYERRKNETVTINGDEISAPARRLQGIQASLIGFAPVSKSIDLVGKVGRAWMTSQDEDTANRHRNVVGAGVQFGSIRLLVEQAGGRTMLSGSFIHRF